MNQTSRSVIVVLDTAVEKNKSHCPFTLATKLPPFNKDEAFALERAGRSVQLLFVVDAAVAVPLATEGDVFKNQTAKYCCANPLNDRPFV